MSKNEARSAFLNATEQTEEKTAFFYDAEINNYIERPVAVSVPKITERQVVIYNPETNSYDEPPAP